MPVNQEEFKKALEALPNGSELLEFHVSAVTAEKSRGIEESRKTNKEAQALRKYKQIVEKLGYDGEQDLEEFAQSLSETIEGKTSKGNSELSDLQKKIAKIQRDFEASQNELKTEREQRTALQQLNKVKTIESKLGPKLSEEFYGSQYLIKALLADGLVDLDDSGEIIFKQGDQTIGFEEGFKKLSETHAESRKNKQAAGAGSQASTQASRPKYSRDQLKAMTPEQIAADLANVNASLK